VLSQRLGEFAERIPFAGEGQAETRCAPKNLVHNMQTIAHLWNRLSAGCAKPVLDGPSPTPVR